MGPALLLLLFVQYGNVRSVLANHSKSSTLYNCKDGRGENNSESIMSHHAWHCTRVHMAKVSWPEGCWANEETVGGIDPSRGFA